jgi:hypothetical protein
MLIGRQRQRREASAQALPKAWRRYEDAAEKVWA